MFSLAKPLPAMLTIKHRLLTAEQFHIAAAHLLLLFHNISPDAHLYALIGHPFITSVRLLCDREVLLTYRKHLVPPCPHAEYPTLGYYW